MDGRLTCALAGNAACPPAWEWANWLSENHGGQETGKGLNAFFRLGWADGRFNEVERFVSGGLRRREPVRGRSRDSAGIALVWSGSSRRARNALARAGEHIAANNWAFEATYERGRRALMGGLRFNVSRKF